MKDPQYTNGYKSFALGVNELNFVKDDAENAIKAALIRVKNDDPKGTILNSSFQAGWVDAALDSLGL